MKALLAVSRAIDTVTEFIGRRLSLLVVLLVTVGFVNVVLRFSQRFFGRSLTSNAIIELQWYMFTILFLMSFAYILKENLNVRVDFLYTNWSARRRAWVNLIGHLLFLIPFCLLGMYVSYGPVMRSWGLLPDGTFGTWEISPDPDGLPRAPIKSMLLLAFVLLLVQGFSEIIKQLAIITGTVSGEEAARIEEYHAAPIE